MLSAGKFTLNINHCCSANLIQENVPANPPILVDALTKQDIIKLEPFITDIKVSTEEIISLKR